jgi:hypothetical protein
MQFEMLPLLTGVKQSFVVVINTRYLQHSIKHSFTGKILFFALNLVTRVLAYLVVITLVSENTKTLNCRNKQNIMLH